MTDRHYLVRPFVQADAEPLSDMICRTLRTVNGKDYPAGEIEKLSLAYRPGRLLEIAKAGSLYVAEEDGETVGCGAVIPYEGRPADAYIIAVFTAADRQGQGIGTAVMSALEADPIFLSAARVELHASVTAHRFYERLGYAYMGGVPRLADGCYPMEKN